MLAPWKKSYDQPRQHIKKRRYYFADKGPHSQSYGFSSSHVRMWELDHKEGWAPEELMLLNCGVGEDSWESLGLQGDQTQLILKEISPEYSLEGLMLKLKLQSFGHLMQRTDSLEKTDAGKNWRQEEKGMTEDEMVRWHHWLDGHEFEQALGVGDGQGSLVCRLLSMGSQRVRHDWATELNWTDEKKMLEARKRIT